MNGYLTDEELNGFIEKLEEKELYAPAHLKSEIFEKLNKQKSGKPVSFLLYTFKLAVGMAAAIVLVFTLPLNDGSAVSRAEAVERNYEAEAKRLQEEAHSGKRLSVDEKLTRYRAEKRKSGSEKPKDMIDKFNNFLNGGNENEN